MAELLLVLAAFVLPMALGALAVYLARPWWWGALAAVVLFWIGQVLAYPFVFGFEPYYDVYVDQPHRLLGLSPLTDQKLAGLVMMIEQAATLGVAILLLLRLARRARATRSVTPELV